MKRRSVCTLLAGASTLFAVAPAYAAALQAAPQPSAAASVATDSAQAAPTTTSTPEPAAAAAANTADIVVTGSRIVRNGYTAPTPVTVATTEELSRSTPSSVPDALNKLPQFSNSLSPSKSANNFSNNPIHGNVLNLRGLGTAQQQPQGAAAHADPVRRPARVANRISSAPSTPTSCPSC